MTATSTQATQDCRAPGPRATRSNNTSIAEIKPKPSDPLNDINLSNLRSLDPELAEQTGNDLTRLVEKISYRVCSQPGIREDTCQETLLKLCKTFRSEHAKDVEGNPHNYVETAFRRTLKKYGNQRKDTPPSQSLKTRMNYTH